MNFNYYFTEICSLGSNQQYSSIASNNGLALTRGQAIIWADDGKFTDTYMHHSASMDEYVWWEYSQLIYFSKFQKQALHLWWVVYSVSS